MSAQVSRIPRTRGGLTGRGPAEGLLADDEGLYVGVPARRARDVGERDEVERERRLEEREEGARARHARMQRLDDVLVRLALQQAVVCTTRQRARPRCGERDGVPVMPTISFVAVIQAAMLSRILCPAWRWSKVPPRAVTGNKCDAWPVGLCVSSRLLVNSCELSGLGESQMDFG